MIIKWLLSCQTTALDEEDAPNDIDPGNTDSAISYRDIQYLEQLHFSPAPERPLPYVSDASLQANRLWAGFNGRCNKIADTCYAFWVGGSLQVWNLPASLVVRLRLPI